MKRIEQEFKTKSCIKIFRKEQWLLQRSYHKRPSNTKTRSVRMPNQKKLKAEDNINNTANSTFYRL